VVIKSQHVSRQICFNFLQGFQYELGDFRVKAGRAVLAPVENLRGIIMEVLFLLHILVLVVCLDFGADHSNIFIYNPLSGADEVSG
jgi:hypothetical protein